jgi:colicin import membrane protein
VEQERSSNQEEERLSRGLGVSFVVHGVILLLFTVKAVFFTPEQIDFSQAVRVDIVGLPDKEPPKLDPPKAEAKPALPEKPVEKPAEKAAEKPAPPPPKPEPVKAPPKDEGVNLEKNKAKQQSAIEKLKAMAALEKIKEDVDAEKKKEVAKGKADDGATKVKGNVLSPGTALTGLAKLQHDNYAADLDAHIKQHWALPEWLAKRDLKAQARVQIDSRGNILGRKIVKSSGNPSYDEEVLATIDRSAPFPAPPEKFLAIVSVDGILIGFPE